MNTRNSILAAIFISAFLSAPAVVADSHNTAQAGTQNATQNNDQYRAQHNAQIEEMKKIPANTTCPIPQMSTVRLTSGRVPTTPRPNIPTARDLKIMALAVHIGTRVAVAKPRAVLIL